MGVVELILVVVVVGCCFFECLFNNKLDEYLDYSNILIVVFSYLLIGIVGLMELQVCEQYGDDQVKVYKFFFIVMYIVVIIYCQLCCMKLVCVGSEEKIVGIYGIGFGMDEMLQGFVVVLKMGVIKKDFDNIVVIYLMVVEEFVIMC